MKSLAFLYSVLNWSHLAHSWLVLNYMCKLKQLGIDKYIIITFQFPTSSFFKRFFFVFVSFVLVPISISVNLLGNREIHYNQLSITRIVSFPCLVFLKNNFHDIFIYLDCDINAASLKTMLTSIHCNVIFVVDG